MTSYFGGWWCSTWWRSTQGRQEWFPIQRTLDWNNQQARETIPQRLLASGTRRSGTSWRRSSAGRRFTSIKEEWEDLLQRRLRWEDHWSWRWMTLSLEQRTSRRWRTQKNFRGGHLDSCQWWQELWENKFSTTPWSSRRSWHGQSTWHLVTYHIEGTAKYVKKPYSSVHLTGKSRRWLEEFSQ